MWSELKYVKAEYLPNQFVTSIQGKKNGYQCTVPCDELNMRLQKMLEQLWQKLKELTNRLREKFKS